MGPCVGVGDGGFQLSLELLMMCVDNYERKPPIHEKIIKKKKDDVLDNKLMHLYQDF